MNLDEFEELIRQCREAWYRQDPEITGVTVQEHVTKGNGVELIIRMQLKGMEEKGRALAIYFCLSDEDIERIGGNHDTGQSSEREQPCCVKQRLAPRIDLRIQAFPPADQRDTPY